MAKQNSKNVFNWKVGDHTGMIDAKTILQDGAYYKVGYIITKNGIVGYYMEPKFFWLDIVANGRQIRRRFEKILASDRIIKMSANKFAKEVANG